MASTLVMLATVCILSARDIVFGHQTDIDRPDGNLVGASIERLQAEIISQHQDKTIDEPEKRLPRYAKLKYYEKDEDLEEKSEKNQPNYGYVDDTKTKFPPKFKHPSKLFNMDYRPAGSSFRLRCAAEGNPTPNITWYKNKATPIMRSYFQPSYGKWSMVLDELTKADNGNYTCVVCNELDCIEHTVVLFVQERYPSKPIIKEGYPGNINVLVNDTVQLSCPPISDLEPYLYWLRPWNMSLKDGELGPSDMPIPVGDVIESQNPQDKPEHLTLYNITKKDEGWYVCVALNSLGNTTSKGYLTVLEKVSPQTSDSAKQGAQDRLLAIETLSTEATRMHALAIDRHAAAMERHAAAMESIAAVLANLKLSPTTRHGGITDSDDS